MQQPQYSLQGPPPPVPDSGNHHNNNNSNMQNNQYMHGQNVGTSQVLPPVNNNTMNAGAGYGMMPQQQHQFQQPVYNQNPMGMQNNNNGGMMSQQQQHPMMYNNNNGMQPQQLGMQGSGMVNNNIQQQQQPSGHQPRQPGSRTMHRPPYCDPNTNILYDTADAEYEGWLTKQSTWLKEWRRRYFILKGSKLFFAKNEYAAPHGMIDLATCTTVKSADLKSRKRHSLEISTPDTTHLLYADAETAKDDWIGRVGKAIVRCSRTYYNNKSSSQNNNGMSSSLMPNQNHAEDESDDDDIYVNEDPDNPYFND